MYYELNNINVIGQAWIQKLARKCTSFKLFKRWNYW